MWQALNPFAKKFKNQIPDQTGKNGNAKIGDGENIFNGESQALALAIGPSKLSHQKICIEQEDDKTDFDHRPPNRR
jgi:hypothetical protein